MEMPDSLEGQTRNCFRTIGTTLAEAGFSLSDIVRIRYYATTREHARKALPIFGQYLADIRPAATLIICETVECGNENRSGSHSPTQQQGAGHVRSGPYGSVRYVRD